MLRRLITMSTPSRSSLGKYGEDFACRYLQNMGYKILTRNFRCHRYGEIDLIVEKKWLYQLHRGQDTCFYPVRQTDRGRDTGKAKQNSSLR